MSAPTRRGFFGFLAGAAAAPMVAKIPVLDLPAPVNYVVSSGITAELMVITRKAFVPKLVVQLYKTNPLLSLAMEARGND